jgi:small subunit ribosomal protein S2
MVEKKAEKEEKKAKADKEEKAKKAEAKPKAVKKETKLKEPKKSEVAEAKEDLDEEIKEIEDELGEDSEESIPDEALEYISATEGKKLLIDPEEYLKSGVHIGLTYRTGNMRKFIYKVRQDRLSIFSLNSIDERIRLAAKMLSKFEKDDILIIGSRAYARRPVRKFAESTGVKYVSGRFRPGSFTNPQERNFREPKLILVADPIADKQAVREAARVGIPVIGVCDSNALTRNLDLIIPLNNKGKQSIALMFWLLTKEYLVERGEMKEKDELKESVDDYISQIQPTKRIESLIKARKKDRFEK